MHVGVQINFYLGQRVEITSKHNDGITGCIKTLSTDEENGITALVVLDKPLVLEATEHLEEIQLYTQLVSILDLKAI